MSNLEKVMKKAIEGEFIYTRDKTPEQKEYLERVFSKDSTIENHREWLMDAKFWQALGKAARWGNVNPAFYPMKFMEKNILEGFDKAVEYLLDLIK